MLIFTFFTVKRKYLFSKNVISEKKKILQRDLKSILLLLVNFFGIREVIIFIFLVQEMLKIIVLLVKAFFEVYHLTIVSINTEQKHVEYVKIKGFGSVLKHFKA